MADVNDGGYRPWVDMWLAPRRTVRRLIETDPKRGLVELVCAAGVVEGLSVAADGALGDELALGTVLVLVLVAGVIGGLLGLYLWTAILVWTGRWYGGTAAFWEMRTAYAWGMTPQVAALGVWVLATMLFGEELFMSAAPRMDASVALSTAALVFSLAIVVLSAWTFVLVVRSVAEAQRFVSAWKGLLNVLTAALVCAVPLFLLGVVLAASGDPIS